MEEKWVVDNRLNDDVIGQVLKQMCYICTKVQCGQAERFCDKVAKVTHNVNHACNMSKLARIIGCTVSYFELVGSFVRAMVGRFVSSVALC